MKIIERNRAIELRKQGKTFREIAREIPISRGSLSYWLRGIVLTPEQIARIQYKNAEVKKKFIAFNELKNRVSEDNKRNISGAASREIDKITQRELKFIGIALYWAEGYKSPASTGVEFTK
ncbi:MAG: hypothetical protein WC532_08685 [Candidatus Omnitrophota bacterium]